MTTIKKSIVLISVLFAGLSGFAQLSIEDCHAKARANYPLIRQYDLIERSKNYNLSNAAKGYLPQVQLSAKASYQSEVTEIPIDFSQLGIPGVNVPQPDKDQYGATIEVNQPIWDGGGVKAKRESIRAQSEADAKELEVSLYAVNDRVNQLFFGILLCDAMTEQNQLFQNELQRNYDRISACIQSGVANQSDLDIVKVEQLKAKQSLIQIVYSRKAYIAMLSAFIGEELDGNISLQKPDVSYSPSVEIRRPELAMFDSRDKLLETAKRELNAGLTPRLSLFLTGGYGKPGLNMLKDEFSAYYVGGIRLTWNIGGFYSRKNSLSLIASNQNAVQIQRETFLFNTSLNKTGKETEIDQYRELLQSDDEIIALRNSVKQSAEAKLAGGTLNASDLMREVIAEQSAKQDKVLHEIKMLQAIYNLKFITNN
jgi:outer membrane protein TolC